MSALLLLLSVALNVMPAQATPERAVFGRWHVTGVLCPAGCGIGQTAADAWRGRSGQYSDTLARFHDSSCRKPRYATGYWPASGSYGGARLTELGISADSVLVVEVRCPSAPHRGSDPRWQAPGAFLVVTSRDRLLLVWQGVFFELSRDA